LAFHAAEFSSLVFSGLINSRNSAAEPSLLGFTGLAVPVEFFAAYFTAFFATFYVAI